MAVTVVGMYEAKTNFSKLVRQVAEGEEIVISKGGTPVAKLVPYEEAPPKPRKPGMFKGMIEIAPNFDDPIPGFTEYFDLGK